MLVVNIMGEGSQVQFSAARRVPSGVEVRSLLLALTSEREKKVGYSFQEP